MPSAAINHAPTHIPAWKRLGLKLKSQLELATESPTPIESSKRKSTTAIDESPPKKAKKNSSTQSSVAPQIPVLSQKKSVTFTPETKVDDGDSIKQLFNSWVTEQKSEDLSFELKRSQPAFQTPQPSKVIEQVDSSLDEKERRATRIEKPKQGKGSKKLKSKTQSQIAKPSIPSSRPYLQYLRQYDESRETWKFNKNHQTHLLKHFFDIDIIPSDHAHLIRPYVRGLQGGVRTRLRDSALAIKVKDQEEGVAGFPEDMADLDKRQREYEAAMNEYVATMTAADASPEMGYEEGILLGLSDAAMAKRVAKRTRAEQILAELALSPDGSGITDKDAGKGDTDSQKRLRLNSGATQKIARKRKQRTVTVDSSSSSESDDSGEDSSDESTPENAAEDDTTSSSSSSSSSPSGSSSESGAEDEESDSGDSSGDSEDEDDE